jgi:predicted DNA-binding transcriptional regulator YafY
MNRTDRLYALVEELRAAAPRPRTADQLARRFEVSVRTIERDLGALLEAGLPIYTRPGPGGGYAIDKAHTLPPVNFTPDEATALAIALARPAESPLADALASALRKVVAAMPAGQAEAAQRLAQRISLLPHPSDARPATAAAIEQALLGSLVVDIAYEDRNGVPTHREVEPMALVGSGEAWYLFGHCRLRQDQRSFKLDRIRSARLTGERSPERALEDLRDPPPDLRRLSLLE